VAAAADEDPLAGFFSEINKEADANNGIKKEDKVMNEKYLNQELGTAQQQVDRLLGSNYKWKNLNPYEVLLLDVDATVEDIKARYRKLSTMVHPDKQRHIENARDAFEEVKKAYQALLDEGRRNTVAETIQIVRKRVAKERSKLTSKGMTAAQLLEKHGTEEAHSKREVMKEFAAIEVRRREIDDHKAAQKKRERDKEDKEHKDLKKVHEREKTWNQDDGREKRVGNWRDFTTAKPEATKKTRMWKEEEREVEEEKKKGGVAAGKFNYKKQWK
jgi:DnaJ family protein C protein 8